MTLQSRRQALALIGTGALSGCCCSLRGFPKPEIGAGPTVAAGFARTGLLAPARINTRDVPTETCIDAHAHFFNASDVTVKGFIEGPVAYSVGGALGELVKRLGPIADALGEIAPTAKSEYDALKSKQASFSALAPDDRKSRLLAERESERRNVSVEFNKLAQSSRGKPFREAYAALGDQSAALSASERRPRIQKIDDGSLFNAMQAAEANADATQLRELAATDRSPYKEGILAFVGYMLSSRHHNLSTYQAAFTEGENTIGVRRTLGALVDFDRWLDCAPRSAHEDQLKLHAELSRQSDYYMLPMISYNPWTDIAEGGRGIELVEEAVRHYGAVGVKIYPPNGFRPWGNTGTHFAKAPDGAQIDRVLEKFWLTCQALQVPVLAHAGPSMGKDAAHSRLSGPDGWNALLEARFWKTAEGPRVSLGHFGGESGDSDVNDWTARFASLMDRPRGGQIYADLGYWERLQCEIVDQAECEGAKARLAAVLNQDIGGGERVGNRVMYGSDWLMLSKEKNWPSYAQQLSLSVRSFAPQFAAPVFGENAVKCFGSRLQLQG
jgi:hypothetical protein